MFSAAKLESEGSVPENSGQVKKNAQKLAKPNPTVQDAMCGSNKRQMVELIFTLSKIFPNFSRIVVRAHCCHLLRKQIAAVENDMSVRKG